MSQIAINGMKNFKEYESAMEAIRKELNSTAEEIQIVRKNLRSSMLMNSYASICSSIDNTKRSVENCGTKVNKLKDAARTIEEQYQNSESQIYDLISGNSLQPVEVTVRIPTDVPSDRKNEKTDQGNEKEFDNSEDVLESVNWWLKLIDVIRKATGLEWFSPIISATKIISGFAKLFKGSYDSVWEYLKDFAGVWKDGMSLTSGLLKLYDQKAAAQELGLFASVLGSIKELIGVGGMDLDEYLQNAGKLISSGGTLGTSLFSFLNPDYFKKLKETSGLSGVYKEKVGNIAAICSLFTMGTQAVGSLMSAYEDGKLSWSEIGQTAISTGVAGADSLISGLTFGLIDIDAKETVDTLNGYSDFMKQIIIDSGLPVEAQAVLGVISSPVVVTATVIDTIAGTVEDGINWIKGIFSWS